MSAASSAPTARTAGPSGRTAAGVLVAAVLLAMLAMPVRTWFLQQAQISQAQQQLEAVTSQVAKLQQQQKQWKDKAFVEQQARERLNYVYPGEVGVVVLQPATAPTPDQQPKTWYDSLWQTVDSASGRGQTALGEPVQVRPDAPR